MGGEYSKLEGGMPLFALEAMTGDNVSHFKFVDGKWRKMLLAHLGFGDVADIKHCGLKSTDEAYDTNEMFSIIEKYRSQDACIAAYSKGKSDTNAVGYLNTFVVVLLT